MNASSAPSAARQPTQAPLSAQGSHGPARLSLRGKEVLDETTTLIYEDRRPIKISSGEGHDLRIAADQLTACTGWELRPEGLCRSGVCVPVPADRAELLDPGGATVNVAVLAELCGQPLVRDDEQHVCVVGTSSVAGIEGAVRGPAPDFALPDLEGIEHRLSDYRGRRVLLFTWASW